MSRRAATPLRLIERQRPPRPPATACVSVTAVVVRVSTSAANLSISGDVPMSLRAEMSSWRAVKAASLSVCSI